MQLWFNRQGEPIDAATANDLLSNTAYVHVARTRITSSSDPTVDFDVSTVWLGCNYGLVSDALVLFETMVFGGSEAQDQSIWRYGTEQQAIAGHREVVATIAATVHDEVVADEAAPAPAVAPQASVLDRIDDTLADWNGSKDSMRWRPDPTPEQVEAALRHMAEAMTPVIRAWSAQFAAITKAMNETLIPMARALGYLPPPPPRPSKLDARYRRRLKNRRKRRH